MISLRPYQTESVYTLIPNSFRAGHKRIIRTAPTGSGKSLEMSELTRLTYNKGNRTILLTHRRELFKSTLAHLNKSGIPVAELDAKKDLPVGDWRVLLAMSRTLLNRIKKNPNIIPKVGLIIIDEGHINEFSSILPFFPDAFVVTFTASPQGKHIYKLYTDIVDNIGIPELIAQGFLTPCKPYMMKDPEGFDNVKRKGSEFDEKDLFRFYDKASRYKGVIDEYFRLVNGLKGMVFCVNVDHTIKTFEAFKEAGINTYMCHSKQSEKERIAQVEAFESSLDGVMINCGILTTGYSHDPIMFIFIDRATTSTALWLQMQGRGSRLHPGKECFIVGDFGDNHTRLGLWNQPRTWTLKEPKKKKEQAAPVKTCPQCSAMVYASARLCPHCGNEFPAPTFELREGIMCEVGTNIPLGVTGKKLSELSIEELISCTQSERIKPTYAWRILRTREKEGGVDLLTDYAKKMGYSNGWLWHQRSKMDDETQIGFKDLTIH